MRISLKNQPVRVKKWYMILSMEEFQSQRSDRGVWIPQTLTLDPPLSDTIQLYDQWKLLQWGLRAGHLSSFLVPTAGYLAAQLVSQPPRICHARKKNWYLTDALCRGSAISSSQNGQNFLPFLLSYSTATTKVSLDLQEVSLLIFTTYCFIANEPSEWRRSDGEAAAE